MQPRCSEAEFIEYLANIGPTETAKRLGISLAKVFARRRNIEQKTGRTIIASKDGQRHGKGAAVPFRDPNYPHRIVWAIKDGVVIVGGDAHYWPGQISTAHRAFVKFIRDLKPVGVVMNGDVFDGSSISRHPPIGWENRPAVIDELDECKARLEEIRTASRGANLAWSLGNHDARFETRLAMVAPEYAKVHGVHLRDHFPDWPPCWSVWVNDDVVIKHRFKNGIHAPHNNTMWAGRTMVTGHLHSQKVSPFTDYNGDRWGVDAGTLAEIYGPHATDYTEDSPRNWRSGFAVLTFADGRLLQPELVRVMDDKGRVDFRGKVCRV